MYKNFVTSLRLFVRGKHKEPYLRFRNILGFVPNNISYYEMALIHRSSAIRKNGEYINNERLEFLGDAVLGMVIADMLYRHYDHQKEGFLSNTRSKIVQRETLNRVAVEIGLDKLIVTSKKNNIQKNNLYGNAFEALIGAIYLDQGYRKCQEFIEKKIFTSYINLEKIIKKEINFKSQLLEVSQKHRIELVYNLLQERKCEKNKMFFESEVLLNNIPVATGTGNSKKESQQHAAQSALKKIKSDKELFDKIVQNKFVEEETSLEN